MDEIPILLNVLKTNLKEKSLSSAKRLQTLSLLKFHITSAEAAALFDQDGIEILCCFALTGPQYGDESSFVALKCLANVLLLGPKTRQIFVNGGYAPVVAKRLTNSLEDELICTRILFLLTYETKFDFNDLFEHESLADRLHQNIDSHASHYMEYKRQLDRPEMTPIPKALPTLEPGALTESLKLLFNLNQFYPYHVADFTRTIIPILQILTNIQLQVQALQQPIVALINSLLSLDLPGPVYPESTKLIGYTPLFPEYYPHDNHLRLINILESGVRSSNEEQLEGLLPLITLLRRVYELAPPGIKEDMQAQLLPSNEERTQPLGQTNSLASHLLRLSTSPTVSRLQDGISNLLFELSDKDATTFVRNVGYGFAAGYLMTHNLPVPENATGDPGENITTIDGQEINPITGQRRDMEPEYPMPDMTDEEKEREAEKLFVLFERLKATGVMNVMNPVEQAVQEGRFEEVDD